MPKAFEDCVNNGGRVRTVSGPSKEHGLKEGENQRFCYLGEESFAGEIYKTKEDRKTFITR
ncbi:MAG: hypothetical protein JXQ30_08765 [Spirochaetes bacterium]|nr:hypothetical protein [Spirochaetota bacterium]